MDSFVSSKNEILILVSSLHVPRGNYDTWNTPSEGYIDNCMLAVYPFDTLGVNKLSGAIVGEW
jgi:hypothetical protein